ncbi:hypothetical protein HK099_006818 [Clydaea vesicula]|uniref:Potassium channel tetramerisation-type BTB domain-containing protein n=1 Tax=Clydaea vesicula TaxID=447962 RepID=A0AAD5U5S8_9FUNG|nr:hypothetical protein HK099_006818 [Clydaea vesicula]
MSTISALPVEESSSSSQSNSAKPKTNKKSWLTWSQEVLTDSLVETAILLKKSPIPSAVTLAGEATNEGYRKLDEAADINSKLQGIGSSVIKQGIIATGVVGSALLKAGVAYQRAPGYSDDKEDEIHYSSVNRVKWVKLNPFPGGFPKPDMLDMATQTVEEEQIGEEQPGGIRGYVAKAALLAGNYTHSYLAPTSSTNFNRSLKSKESADLLVNKQSSEQLKTKPSLEQVLSAPSSLTEQQKLKHKASKLSMRKMASVDSMSSFTSASTQIPNNINHNNNLKNLCTICGAKSLIYNNQLSDLEDELFFPSFESISSPFVDKILVHLNVGGLYIDTTLETLTCVKDSLLYDMFNGIAIKERDDLYEENSIGISNDIQDNMNEFENFNSKTPPIGPDGRFFLDRDGSLFHHILNNLRNTNQNNDDTLETLPTSKKALWSLVSEAKYFKLKNFEIQVRKKIIKIRFEENFVFPLADFL